MSVITLENKDISIDQDNFIYSKCSSRPSKSVVDPEKYTLYKTIQQTFTFLDDSDDILFVECISYIFYTFTKTNELVYILDGETYKVVNFNDNKFKILTENLKDKYNNYIITFKDIYTYPKIQYIYMLSKFFTKVKIVMSQIKSYCIIICFKRSKNFELNVKNNYIKDFNIKVDESIIRYIKKDNDVFLENAISMNKNILDIRKSISEISNLNKETYTLNKYYKAFINKECSTYCSCRPNCIIYSNLFQCYICEHCLILSKLLLF